MRLLWTVVAAAAFAWGPGAGAPGPAPEATVRLASAEQDVRFTLEILLITLGKGSFRFHGTYYFDNPGPETVRPAIFYPYALSGATPESLSVVDIYGKKLPAIAQGDDGISFTADIPSETTRPYVISFSQRAPEHRFEYSLVSTGKWGRPLDRMVITILAPPGVRVKSIVPHPDKAVRSADGTRYMIERRMVMPDRNLVVQWDTR